ncbi:PDDEXK-like family protein [Brumimicrobium mesophilum]|uniref:PDDEXK-like family protein n=1 Tax=Brumimicrobium mesophilum TaxID=392717 RepID=UPI000D1442F3|nr:PD-(D/E)XK nuclease family protein [Brumimicrobium mesophilum]
MTEVNTLLLQVQTIVNSYSRINKMSGQSFNLFTLLKKENEEVPLHSMFLAELLNPKGSHQQETLYLDLFLQQLDIKDFDSEGATCLKEYYTGRISDDKTRGGNIDLLIRSVKGEVIKIENKIDAGEQENQLLRYHNYKNQGRLIYLTLKGEESRVHEELDRLGVDYQQISYKKDIKEWLEACIEKSATVPIVRESIVQYLNLVKKLTFQNINKEMSKEIAKKITKSKESFEAYRSMRKTEDEIYKNVIQDSLMPFFKEFASENNMKAHDLDESLINERKQFVGFFFSHEKLSQYGLRLSVQFGGHLNRHMFYGLSFININPVEKPIYHIIAKEAKNVMDKPNPQNEWWLCNSYWQEYNNWGDIDTLYKMAFGKFKEEFESKMKDVLDMALSVIEDFEKKENT